jgi:putative sugar O-methyltransferase
VNDDEQTGASPMTPQPTSPSRFWTELSAEHQRELEEFGLEHVKRHQALRYFTFAWWWRYARRDPQVRFLMRHTSARAWFGCARQRTNLSDAAWEGATWMGIPWPRRMRWLYAFLVRLLFEYARAHDPHNVLRLDEPVLGDPWPVRHHGRLISQDLCNSALEAGAMTRPLDGRAPTSILEIGGGYGRIAYALLSMYPQATYTIVDIEPALTISRWYLSQLFDPERLRFVSPDELADLEPGSVDLAVSISTFPEMSAEQVAMYLRLVDSVAAGGVVYFKQLADWHNPADQVRLTFGDYPVPARWRLEFVERAPVQTQFWHAGWTVPA